MKTHLISGGCGFVGRNMVKRLYKNTTDRILFIDNLSVGKHPSEWLGIPLKKTVKSLKYMERMSASALLRKTLELP